ncbi:MAG: SET domain-containing protein-lysine N-methyltransferase [Bacteroidetes bacterium]|nr:SET domain-containing protein-lysine N-methyltransferase [Bacteroidota bacterium]
MEKVLYIKEVKGKGRGVFCKKAIGRGAIIEICPVIVVPATDIAAIENTKLADYSFYFNKEENSLSLAMGFGSMYNYAQYPNATYQLDRDNKTMIYTAHEDIPAHTEITINYGGEYGHDYSKWFTDRHFKLI